MQIDRLYNWKSVADAPIRDSFKRQKEHVMTEFEQRSSQVFLQLNELVCVCVYVWVAYSFVCTNCAGVLCCVYVHMYTCVYVPCVHACMDCVGV